MTPAEKHHLNCTALMLCCKDDKALIGVKVMDDDVHVGVFSCDDCREFAHHNPSSLTPLYILEFSSLTCIARRGAPTCCPYCYETSDLLMSNGQHVVACPKTFCISASTSSNPLFAGSPQLAPRFYLVPPATCSVTCIVLPWISLPISLFFRFLHAWRSRELVVAC